MPLSAHTLFFALFFPFEPGFLGGIGSGEIVIVMVVLLLLFGPKQLPDLAKTIGQALRGIRKASDDLKEEIGLDEFMDPTARRRARYSRPVSSKSPPAPEAAPDSARPVAEPEPEVPTESPESESPVSNPYDQPEVQSTKPKKD